MMAATMWQKPHGGPGEHRAVSAANRELPQQRYRAICQASTESGHTRHRVVLVGLLIIVILLLGWNVYYRAVQSEFQRSDFVMFYAAGRAAVDGTDIYAVAHPRGWPFYYPPAMAAMMVPLAALPFPLAVLLWYAINVAAMLAGVRRLIAMCEPFAPHRAGPIVVLAVLVNFGPVFGGLMRGQISALLFFLMVEAIWSFRQSRPGRGGIWIALAVSLKVYPALMILPLLVQRSWRALLTWVIGIAVFFLLVPVLALGPGQAWDDITDWANNILLPFFSDPSFVRIGVLSEFNQYSPSNQSFFGVLARWLACGSLPEKEPFALSLANLSADTVRLLAAAGSILLVVWIIRCAWAAGGWDTPGQLVMWTLPMVAANFISHIAWHHYYTVLIAPYAVAATLIVADFKPPGRRLMTGVLAAAVLCNWLHYAISPMCRQMGILMLGSLLLCCVQSRACSGAARASKIQSPTQALEDV